MSGLAGFWVVFGWFGWFVAGLTDLWVVWLVCGWFRVLQLTFPVNFVKFLRKPFFTEHFWWLHLMLNFIKLGI